MGKRTKRRMMRVCSLVVICLATLPAMAVALGECQSWEFEQPHREWSASCVAQWLGGDPLNMPEHIQARFEAHPIEGKDLKGLNDTALAVPASEGGLNVTEESDRAKIIDGVKRLEQHDPSDSTDSGLYLPLMLIGCMFFVYVMFIKETHFERQVKNWARKMSKKVKASDMQQAGAGGDQDDWLVGTSASGGANKRPRNRGKK